MSGDEAGPPTTASGPGLRELRLPLALGLVALLVRLPGSGGELWLDEVATLLDFVRAPLAQIVGSYGSANNHVLYSVLARLSSTAFGESPFALRLPALLFGAASVPVLYLLARTWLTRVESGAAAFLLAVSYHHAYFSQNARGYTGLVFFALLSTLFLARGLAARKTWQGAGVAVSSALGAYVLLSGVFVTASQALGVATLGRALGGRGPDGAPVGASPGEGGAGARRWGLSWLVAGGLLTAVLFAPLLPGMVEFYTTADADVGWEPGAGLFQVVLREALPTGSPWLAGALLAAGPVVAWGGIRLARRAPLLIVSLVLPPVLELAAATVLGAGTYPRRFLLLLPFVVLAGVHGTLDLVRRVGRVTDAHAKALRVAFLACVAVAAVGGASGLPRLYTVPKQDFESALELVRSRSSAGDAVAATYVATTLARYHDPDLRRARGPEEVRGLLGRDRTVWLVGTFTGDMERRAPELARLVRSRFREVGRFPSLVGDGAVVVWRSLPDAGMRGDSL